mmetsp:Transcript_25523/g.44508  ORF Transcript_25523/g.44508 Transcript_25523/m.44508 type:complete len:147 (-) Transcript_25523:2008-2448(-)
MGDERAEASISPSPELSTLNVTEHTESQPILSEGEMVLKLRDLFELLDYLGLDNQAAEGFLVRLINCRYQSRDIKIEAALHMCRYISPAQNPTKYAIYSLASGRTVIFEGKKAAEEARCSVCSQAVSISCLEEHVARLHEPLPLKS